MILNALLYIIRPNKQIFINNFIQLCESKFLQYPYRGRLFFKRPDYTLLFTQKGIITIFAKKILNDNILEDLINFSRSIIYFSLNKYKKIKYKVKLVNIHGSFNN